MPKNVSYGRPMLKKLTEKAKSRGVDVSFYIDDNGKYVIKKGKRLYNPPTAVTACHFMMGVIAASPKPKE
jgi:hypothetical protein